jgi:hypothetical protein
MDADAEFDTTIGRQASIALDHPTLNLDRAAHRVNDTSELNENAIAGSLNDAAAMQSDGWID